MGLQEPKRLKWGFVQGLGKRTMVMEDGFLRFKARFVLTNGLKKR